MEPYEDKTLTADKLKVVIDDREPKNEIWIIRPAAWDEFIRLYSLGCADAQPRS